MKITKILSIVFVGLAMVACSQKEKTAYIINQKMFNEFQGTIELQKKLKKTEDLQKYMFDSLSLELKLLSGKSDPKSKAIFQQRQLYANKLYAEIVDNNREMVGKQEADLWKQINQYVNEYGKLKGYTYIFGTSGEGSLMYADTNKNITQDLITYINQKYAGK